MLKLEYSRRTRSMPQLPMTWLLESTGHQQLWFCSCRIIRSLASKGEWVIKFNSLSGDSKQLGPYSPNKPCNHSLYMTMKSNLLTMKSNLLPWFTASVISIEYIWIVQDTDNYKHIHFHKVHRNHTGYIHIHVNIYTWQTEREALAYVPQYLLCNIWYF